MEGLYERLASVTGNLHLLLPEIVLTVGLLLVLFFGMVFHKGNPYQVHGGMLIFSLAILAGALTCNAFVGYAPDQHIAGMLVNDGMAYALKFILDTGALLALMMLYKRRSEYVSAYFMFFISALLGCHLLVMSSNLLMVFLSIEMISISSYLLAGFAFTKQATEGSLKYFIFGSVASAVMLYGLSILYGLSGSLAFNASQFVAAPGNETLVLVAVVLMCAGLLFKISAVPMHIWAPDVYDAAPMPVVAFFSVVPKLAGMGILAKLFLLLSGSTSGYDGQLVLSVVAMVTLAVGNFSALWQKRPKRLMAYSSIAQSGFLLIGIVSFLPQGIHAMLFYGCVYLIMNYAVFIFLDYFETEHGITHIEAFAGRGRFFVWPMVALLTALISLTGLPPTGGFMAKVFIFSVLWKAYETSEKSVLLWLFVFGLINAVVSLFYYLRIPFYAFLKGGDVPAPTVPKSAPFKNFFGFILVLLLLLLFFQPNVLMSWINRINFVL